MAMMYRELQDSAEKNLPYDAPTVPRRVSGFDMRAYKTLRAVWQHRFGILRLALVLLVCVASVSIPPSIICTRIKGLSARQMRFCEDNPDAMGSITRGFQLGVDECKYQFRKRRWNCTSLGSKSPFSRRAVPGTKEAAFTHAIISAGIAHAVTLACTKKNFSRCDCDRSKAEGKAKSGVDGWSWRGCSVNIQRGIQVAKTFLDGQDPDQSDIALMNKHNNEVGREVIKSNLDLQCKCHGPSGSCNMRTCWKWVPLFRTVGDKLKAVYSDSKTSVLVEPVMKLSSAGKVPAYLVLKNNKFVKPQRYKSLVRLRASPSYCDEIASLGVPGTIGRRCNKKNGSLNEDDCEVLCCGRGYNVQETVRKWKCHCKFYWCCEVRCKSCSEKLMIRSCQ